MRIRLYLSHRSSPTGGAAIGVSSPPDPHSHQMLFSAQRTFDLVGVSHTAVALHHTEKLATAFTSLQVRTGRQSAGARSASLIVTNCQFETSIINNSINSQSILKNNILTSSESNSSPTTMQSVHCSMITIAHEATENRYRCTRTSRLGAPKATHPVCNTKIIPMKIVPVVISKSINYGKISLSLILHQIYVFYITII